MGSNPAGRARFPLRDQTASELLAGRLSFQQSECRSFAGLVAADPLHRIDQLAELRGRVVRRDVAVRMPQEHLARFERHPGCTKPPAAGVLLMPISA